MSDGRAAEDAALAHLQRNGLRCLMRNYRGRRGELDLVMDDGGTLVIAEVRSRTNGDYGGALESIDHRKRQKIICATMQLLQQRRFADCQVRFDVIAFDGSGKLEWIRDAFQAD